MSAKVCELLDGIDAVLFDKDGTLADLHEVWVPAYRAAAEVGGADGRILESAGLMPDGRLRSGSPLQCGTTDEVARLLAHRAGTYAAVASTLREHAARPHPPVTDLRVLFDRLANAGLVLGVATMDETAVARRALEQWGVADRVAFVAGSDAGFGHKPEPGMVLAFSAHIGVAPARIAVLGDSEVDLQMAKCAGARAIGVLTGSATEAELIEPGDAVINDISCLIT